MVFAVWAARAEAARSAARGAWRRWPTCCAARRRRYAADPEAVVTAAGAALPLPGGLHPRLPAAPALRVRRGRAGRARARSLSWPRTTGELDVLPRLRRVGWVRWPPSHPHSHREILERAVAGGRLCATRTRWRCWPRATWCAWARRRRGARARATDDGAVTFVVDRNVNYTNFCITDCDFCAFYRHPRDPRGLRAAEVGDLPQDRGDARRWAAPRCCCRAATTPACGSSGTRTSSPTSRRATRSTCTRCRRPRSSTSRTSRGSRWTRRCARLRDAGHDSLPGGGAEILVDRVRQVIAPRKTTTDEWLGVMRAAHRAGMSTTATMMYGTVDTWEDRVEHLRRLRDLQDETGGFRAFVCWSYQSGGGSARGDDHVRTTAADYLMMLAVSRLYLDNFPHFQSSWVTQGLRVGQRPWFTSSCCDTRWRQRDEHAGGSETIHRSSSHPHRSAMPGVQAPRRRLFQRMVVQGRGGWLEGQGEISSAPVAPQARN